jgi:hypothetical protein
MTVLGYRKLVAGSGGDTWTGSPYGSNNPLSHELLTPLTAIRSVGE